MAMQVEQEFVLASRACVETDRPFDGDVRLRLAFACDCAQQQGAWGALLARSLTRLVLAPTHGAALARDGRVLCSVLEELARCARGAQARSPSSLILVLPDGARFARDG